ncbi:MAG: diguanylate cyclase [Gammaproteobacteria bacterium]|nr:diguanylate cyclase [Gammaproteobacteria bacterium]
MSIIAAGFGVSIALMIALVIFGLTRLSDIYGTVEEIVTIEHGTIKSLYIMHGAARDRAVLVHQITQTPDPFDRDELIQQFYEQASVFFEARQRIESLNLSDEEKQLLEKLRKQTSVTAPLLQRVVDLMQAGHGAQARLRLSQEALPSQTRVIQAVTDILEHELKKGGELEQTAKYKRQQAGFFMIAGGSAAIVISILVALSVARRQSDLVSSLVQTSSELKTTLRDLQFQKQALDQHNIVSIADAAGDITYVNQKFIDISGYARDELLGRNHRILKSGHHPPSFYEDMWKTISEGRIWRGQVCNKTKSGALYWVDSAIVPFLDDAGLPYQYVSIRTEITRIKEAERMLQQNKEQLEAVVHERTNELAKANRDLQSEIERRRTLEEHLRDLAITDTLTGIFNRRKFDETLMSEMSRAERYGTPLSLALLDIDLFKQINDKRGHQVGDRVLQALAHLVSDKIRAHDMFARYGGEEFAVLAPGTNSEGCRKLAEKLRAGIEQHDIAETGRVTCSFGVTEFQRGDTTESFVRRADVALYRAKKNGRNRVEEE